MQLNEEQAKERLASPDNLANRLAAFRAGRKKVLDENVLSVSAGRQLPRLPDEVKQEIVERAASGTERQKDIAVEYGITQADVSYLKRSSNERERESASALEKSIKDQACEKMMLAMGLITQEKLEKLKVRDLSNVSTAMAKVLNVVAPKNANQAPLVNLVVYAPEVRDEKSFKIVEINREG